MPTLAEIRARAQRHQDELDRDTRFFTVTDLAVRWHVSRQTVRAISKTVLPYVNLGSGLIREARRYHPDSVSSYESSLRETA